MMNARDDIRPVELLGVAGADGVHEG